MRAAASLLTIGVLTSCTGPISCRDLPHYFENESLLPIEVTIPLDDGGTVLISRIGIQRKTIFKDWEAFEREDASEICNVLAEVMSEAIIVNEADGGEYDHSHPSKSEAFDLLAERLFAEASQQDSCDEIRVIAYINGFPYRAIARPQFESATRISWSALRTRKCIWYTQA
jgi:hypothetical protein